VLIALSEAVNRGWIYPLNSVTHGQWDARATTTFLASPNFRCMLPMAMTQSFAGGVAKCRVLLILWMTSCSGCNKPRKDDASRREARIFTAHRYASAVYAVVVCPSVCLSVLLSVTSRCCIETTGRIELVFLAWRLPSTCPSLVRRFLYLQKLAYFPLGLRPKLRT